MVNLRGGTPPAQAFFLLRWREKMRIFPSSVKGKLLFGFGTLIGLTLVLGLAAYHAVVVIDENANEVARKNSERDLTAQSYEAAEKESSGVRGFLLTNDERVLEQLDTGKSRFADSMAKLPTFVNSEEGKRLVANIQSTHAAYIAVAEREVQLAKKKNSKEAFNVMYTEAIPAFQSFDTAVGEFKTHLDTTLKALNQGQDKTVERYKLLIVILCAVGVLIGLAMGGAIERPITNSLNKITELIQQMAANNLAASDLHMTDRSEIARAGLALDQMKNSLADMIRSISATAEHLASASEEISSSASQQASTAGSQKDQTTQVATALQEMSATVQQVSENSGRAAEASRKAADTARQGGAVVEQTLVKMQVIADSVRGSAAKVEELGKRSDQIGRIVGVINDIADQTNLLALNAAIEAARAGEQGRGFAVVADEVRKLAERTTTSTKEIATMIEAVQSETRQAVQAMEEGTKQVAEGVTTTQKAGEALKQIIQVSQEVGDMVTHIATAATQQSSATEDINNSMNQIARLLIESADGAQQSEKACQELSGLALDLRKLVGTFRLPTGGEVRDYPVRMYSPTRPDSDEALKSFAAAGR
jgi:methyl-accepting chemotaxis protein